jgi:TonB family protein
MNTHPFDPETIMSFFDGELPPASAHEVRTHISRCAECAALVARMRETSSTLSKWTVTGAELSERSQQHLSAAFQKFHRRNSVPFASFFRFIRPRYLFAACALVLAFGLWAELSPSRITLAQEEMQAKLIKEFSPDPRYPQEARDKNIQGIVKLSVLVAKDGSVKKLSVISGDPLLAKSSEDTVRHWKYAPTLSKGKPVEVESIVEISFKLYP